MWSHVAHVGPLWCYIFKRMQDQLWWGPSMYPLWCQLTTMDWGVFSDYQVYQFSMCSWNWAMELTCTLEPRSWAGFVLVFPTKVENEASLKLVSSQSSQPGTPAQPEGIQFGLKLTRSTSQAKQTGLHHSGTYKEGIIKVSSLFGDHSKQPKTGDRGQIWPANTIIYKWSRGFCYNE